LRAKVLVLVLVSALLVLTTRLVWNYYVF